MIFKSHYYFAIVLAILALSQLNYSLSIMLGCAILVVALALLLFNSKAYDANSAFIGVLIYSLVSMDLGPFSYNLWSPEYLGSGFINTPLAKFFIFYLISYFSITIGTSLVLYILFGLLFAITILEGVNIILLDTILSTWSACAMLFVFIILLVFPSRINFKPDIIIFVLKMSVYAIGIRCLFYLCANLFGFTDYLSFGQRPVLSGLYALSLTLFNRKMSSFDFIFIALNLFPVGKVDLIHSLIVILLYPRILFLILPAASYFLINFSNELFLIKIAELFMVIGFDSLRELIGVSISLDDSGSIGTRVAEFKVILSKMIEFPSAFLLGLNGIGISTSDVALIGGNLTSFDYSDWEFRNGLIINVHGFYNKLLYATGFIGLFLYIGLVIVLSRRYYRSIFKKSQRLTFGIIFATILFVSFLFNLYVAIDIVTIACLMINAKLFNRTKAEVGQ